MGHGHGEEGEEEAKEKDQKDVHVDVGQLLGEPALGVRQERVQNAAVHFIAGYHFHVS